MYQAFTLKKVWMIDHLTIKNWFFFFDTYSERTAIFQTISSFRYMKIWGSQTSSFHTTELEYNSYNVYWFVKEFGIAKELVLNR